MIRLKTLLTESININGVTLRAVNTQSGGPMEASWDGNSVQYKVSMTSLTYDGPVGITSIYKSKENNKYYVTTNADQKETLTLSQLNKLVTDIKNDEKEIEINVGWGVTIIFNKKS